MWKKKSTTYEVEQIVFFETHIEEAAVGLNQNQAERVIYLRKLVSAVTLCSFSCIALELSVVCQFNLLAVKRCSLSTFGSGVKKD